MKERLSALMDDSLDDDSAAPVFDRIRSDNDAVRAWHTYHLIGDSLRGDANLHANLVEKVMSRIESEPTVFAPALKRSGASARLRWALPLAASVMGVGAVAWVAQSVNQVAAPVGTVARLGVPQGTENSGQQAKTVAALVSAPPGAQISTPGLLVPVQATFGREYLIAHQAYSPGAKMSGVAQYVRTVSESREESAR